MFDQMNLFVVIKQKMLFVKSFPWCCKEFPDDSLSLPHSEKPLTIPALWPPSYLHQICLISVCSQVYS